MTDTTYANSGACRKAAKRAAAAAHNLPESELVRGTHFQMRKGADERWSFIVLPPEAPIADPRREVAKKRVRKAKTIAKRGTGLTREEWLREGIERLHGEVFMTHLQEQGLIPELPHHRVSCAFPMGARPMQGGKPSGPIGQCWSEHSSEDGAIEMMVSPMLDEPTRVLGVLAHEMCHMYLGNGHGHGKPFKALATAIGLGGKMTATIEEEPFIEAVTPIIADMGEYPHAKLNPEGRKKDGIRQIKVQCNDEECGCTFRLANKWIEKAAESEREGLCCPICSGETTVTYPGAK